MKSNLIFWMFTFVVAGIFAIGCAPNVSNYGEQGGARTVVGGQLDIVSGGELDLESGSVFKTAGTTLQLVDSANDGVGVKKFVRATYDFAVDGGATGTIDLGQDLPANAIVLNNWTYVETQVTDSGSGTVAFECEDSENLYAATDISGQAAGSGVQGLATYHSAAVVDGIAAACNVSIVIGGATITAGKLIHYIEYVVGN